MFKYSKKKLTKITDWAVGLVRELPTEVENNEFPVSTIKTLSLLFLSRRAMPCKAPSLSSTCPKSNSFFAKTHCSAHPHVLPGVAHYPPPPPPCAPSPPGDTTPRNTSLPGKLVTFGLRSHRSLSLCPTPRSCSNWLWALKAQPQRG